MAKNKQSIIAAPTSPLSNPCPSLVHIIHHQLTSCIIFLLTYLVVISVQFSRSVMSNSLQAPWIAAFQASLSITNSRNLPILMSTESVMPFNHLILCCPLLLPSIFSSIRVFPMRQFFASGAQSFGVSALASVLPVNIQDWFPSGLTDLISLQFKGLSRVFSNTTVQKHQFFGTQLSSRSNSHIHTWLLEKP